MGNTLARICCKKYSVDLIEENESKKEHLYKFIPIEVSTLERNFPLLVSRTDLIADVFIPNNKIKTELSNLCGSITNKSFVNDNIYDQNDLKLKYDIMDSTIELKIDLKSLSIDSIHANTFKNMTNVIEIDLSDNNLQFLEASLFQGLINLKKINLHKNKLENIDTKLFNGLTNLEEINLSENLLVKLNAELFDGLNNLKKVFLKGNSWETNEVNKQQIYYFYNVIDIQSSSTFYYDCLYKIDENSILT